jgi:hypothetical protein
MRYSPLHPGSGTPTTAHWIQVNSFQFGVGRTQSQSAPSQSEGQPKVSEIKLGEIKIEEIKFEKGTPITVHYEQLLVEKIQWAGPSGPEGVYQLPEEWGGPEGGNQGHCADDGPLRSDQPEDHIAHRAHSGRERSFLTKM